MRPVAVASHPDHAEATSAPLAEEALERGGRLDLVFPGGGTIAGRVTCGEAGVAGARVSILHRTPGVRAARLAAALGLEIPLRTTFTDPAGRFRLERAPPGEYVLETFHPGYALTFRDLVVRAGETESLELRLERAEPVTGTVADDRGLPVEGATVLAVEDLGLSAPDLAIVEEMAAGLRRTRTDAQGRFRLSGLPSVPLVIVARAEGFECAGARAVEAGEREVEVQLMRLGALRVRVRDAGTAAELEELTLRLEYLGRQAGDRSAQQHPWNRFARGERRAVRAGGSYRLSSLPPGLFRLTVMSHGYAPHEESPIDIDPGETKEVEVWLQGGQAVRGRVLEGEESQPVAGATVTLVTRSARSRRGAGSRRISLRAETDRQGGFRFEHVPAGSYDLSVSHSEYQPARSALDVATGSDSYEEVLLNPAGMVRVRISGPWEERGESPPPLRLELEGTKEPPRTLRTSYGYFLYSVPPGEYDLRVSAPGDDQRPEQSSAARIRVVAGEEVFADLRLSSGPSKRLPGP